MRNAPATRMFRRSVAMKGAYAASRNRSGIGGGNPQFCPAAL